jgi:uncharacterized membrane protein SpoIIM required for sporulation
VLEYCPTLEFHPRSGLKMLNELRERSQEAWLNVKWLQLAVSYGITTICAWIFGFLLFRGLPLTLLIMALRVSVEWIAERMKIRR